MTSSPRTALKKFCRDDRGSIIPTFGVMFLFITLLVGVAVDYGRMQHSQSRLANAADAAALAAGKALLDGRNTDADVQTIARQVFLANFKDGEGYAAVQSFTAKLDRTINSVEIDIQADVPMTITKIAGFETVSLPVSSVAIFDQKDIEVSLALDVTGSMCSPCSKIDALKDATKDLVDIMLPDSGTPNKVRIGFAPYSSGVNAGSYARAATNNRSVNGCTFEREGANPDGDQAPSRGNYLKIAADPGVDRRASCPAATVVGLSDDKQLLKRTVDGYRTGGTTAGHLGAQWAHYLVSPNWGSVFGTESIPSAYNDGKTVKAVVLMTDGENNTFGGQTERARSDNMVRDICANMRDQGIMVFTVGFALRDARAIELLSQCPGIETRAFRAEDATELRQAFVSIAQQLSNLRLSK